MATEVMKGGNEVPHRLSPTLVSAVWGLIKGPEISIFLRLLFVWNVREIRDTEDLHQTEPTHG